MIMKMRSVSTEHTSDYTIPANPSRVYLMVVFTEGSGKLFFNGGDGPVPLTSNHAYILSPVEVGEISVVINDTGKFTVHEGV